MFGKISEHVMFALSAFKAIKSAKPIMVVNSSQRKNKRFKETRHDKLKSKET